LREHAAGTGGGQACWRATQKTLLDLLRPPGAADTVRATFALPRGRRHFALAGAPPRPPLAITFHYLWARRLLLPRVPAACWLPILINTATLLAKPVNRFAVTGTRRVSRQLNAALISLSSCRPIGSALVVPLDDI